MSLIGDVVHPARLIGAAKCTGHRTGDIASCRRLPFAYGMCSEQRCETPIGCGLHSSLVGRMAVQLRTIGSRTDVSRTPPTDRLARAASTHAAAELLATPIAVAKNLAVLLRLSPLSAEWRLPRAEGDVLLTPDRLASAHRSASPALRDRSHHHETAPAFV